MLEIHCSCNIFCLIHSWLSCLLCCFLINAWIVIIINCLPPQAMSSIWVRKSCKYYSVLFRIFFKPKYHRFELRTRWFQLWKVLEKHLHKVYREWLLFRFLSMGFQAKMWSMTVKDLIKDLWILDKYRKRTCKALPSWDSKLENSLHSSVILEDSFCFLSVPSFSIHRSNTAISYPLFMPSSPWSMCWRPKKAEELRGKIMKCVTNVCRLWSYTYTCIYFILHLL